MGEFTIDGILLPAGLHSARPSAGSVAKGTLYPESDTGLIYQSDGASTWTLWATLGGTGLADEGTFTYLDATDGAAPGNPASSHHRLYSKSGGLYYRDNGGTEVGPLGAGGGGGGTGPTSPLKPGTPTDDFNSALSGSWTAGNIASGFSLTNVYGQAQNGSRLWMPFSSQLGYIYLPTTDVDQEWQCGAIENEWICASNTFYGIAILDSSHNGVGMIVHCTDPSSLALIGITSGQFDGATATTVALPFEVATYPFRPVWMRITRTGNTWDGYASVYGAAWDLHVSATISKTITASRKCIGVFGTPGVAQNAIITADWVTTV